MSLLGPIHLRTLIVDDSPLMRSSLRRALKLHPRVSVVGAVGDGKSALQTILTQSVDLVILDLEMPGMDGSIFLKELTMRNLPTQVIIFSAFSPAAAAKTLNLLADGALDFVIKPQAPAEGSLGFEDPAQRIFQVLEKPLQAAMTTLNPRSKSSEAAIDNESETTNLLMEVPKAVVIAASTGGPPALERLLIDWPSQPQMPMFLVQHMPPIFTAQMADRLKRISHFNVVEAQNGMAIDNGTLYVAPGGWHLEISISKGGQPTVHTHKGPMVHSVRPAADLLFKSASVCYGRDILAIVMTGMGDDGAEGAAQIQRHGGKVWIQNRETCAVYGMPGAVERMGVPHWSASPEDLRRKLIKSVCKSQEAA